jgi:predicted RNase H-like HicB family nuclease
VKTRIEVHKEGNYFVAVDLLKNVADQGLSEEEARWNLRKGLEEHYVMKKSLNKQRKGDANPSGY